LSEELRQLAHNIVILGQRHDRWGSDNERHIESLVKGTKDPRSTLEVYRVAGGHLINKTLHPFRIKEGNSHHPLGKHSSEDLIDYIGIASELLQQAANDQASNRKMWTNAAIMDEIDSQTAALLEEHSEGLRQMGRNWQRLADLIVHIYKNNDTKIIEAGNARGKKLDIMEAEPKGVLDLFRFIYGHFGK
jgi:hypothetical protein